MKITCGILLIWVGLLAIPSRAQTGAQAAHEVTVERIGETRVSGPVRIPAGSLKRMRDSARLEVSSNIPLLKVVFTLLEREQQAGADGPQIYSAQEFVHPMQAPHVDASQVLGAMPSRTSSSLDSAGRLVVTVTE